MRHLLVAAVGAIVGLAYLAGGAGAQAPYRSPNFGRTTRPAYSPYLNLFRPGGSFLQNYYGLVRPELDFRSNIQGLQQQASTNTYNIGVLGNAVGNQGAPTLTPTGHATAFNTHTRYFQNRGQGGGQSGGSQVGSRTSSRIGQAQTSRSRGGSSSTSTSRGTPSRP